MTAPGGREWLICRCGWLHVSAAPGERGAQHCTRCGRPSAGFVIASQAQVAAVPDGCTVGVVVWGQNRSDRE